MDRFKFRCWDKKQKKYEDVSKLINQEGELVSFAVRDDLSKFYDIEQCTSLKDKNGKLIYEGDIVEYYNEKIHQNFREEVLPFRELRTKGIMRHLIDERNADKLEVIGNIHENTDLLEI